VSWGAAWALIMVAQASATSAASWLVVFIVVFSLVDVMGNWGTGARIMELLSEVLRFGIFRTVRYLA
jgi:hypothetical protein